MTDVTKNFYSFVKSPLCPLKLAVGIVISCALIPLDAQALITDSALLLNPGTDYSAPASTYNSIFNQPVSNPNALPDLGSSLNKNPAAKSQAFETKVATTLKQFGEDSTASGSDDPLREQAETLALEQAARLVKQETTSLLSPLGTTTINFDVSGGNLSGSSATLLSPLYASKSLLTYSQVGIQHQSGADVGNFGLGQRWSTGAWMLGYNAFIDDDFVSDLKRGSVGAEAWTDYLHLSANYYQPLSGYNAESQGSATMRRMASGYDIRTKAYLPFYRQIGATLSYEQYRGDRVDLFGDGNYQSNPSALSLGVNYTPVPLFTVSAERQQGQSGDNQDLVQLSLTYKLGVPLNQQLSPNYVAEAHSLRGSRFDAVDRNNIPVMEFRQRKTLSVYLATPPWTLQGGESLPLKLEIHAVNKIQALSWQGDTQALSLTSAKSNSDADGWTVIVPKWDDSPGASNSYRLSVTAVDSKQQNVTSNWITLNVSPPLSAYPQQDDLSFSSSSSSGH
ncbi:YchO/YchP family invasin [Serratia sp. M24T3]|uniref:YchO/YchP family invasin n=1 Tax=Serratia sp. M24T3 TaxID=932213 RepID=UPI00025B92E6|nr:putative invasin [Serratia sp. M24T3]